MSDNLYLKRLFRAYYEENQKDFPQVSSLEQREFGFIPWEKQIMIRHKGFHNNEAVTKYMIENGPRHMYSSGALYTEPDHPNMEGKNYIGCDLIIDIDVDHFYTPCKEDHDLWYCKECGERGKGMPIKCPKCKSSKFSTLAWICNDCLKVAKKEIQKLIFDFLIPDFNVKEEEMHIAFSGHRGYHLKIENPEIRNLSSEDRREIVDYVTGENISFELLGLREKNSQIYGLLKSNLGWSQKIMKKLETMLHSYSDSQFTEFFNKIGLHQNYIQSFLNYKKDLLNIITNEQTNYWSIEGFGLKTWEHVLHGIVELVGAEIDEPVSIDIHRLIRYPGSLHGKTGFKVQELTINQLDDYNPLDVDDDSLNPIVFESDILHKVEIIAENVPVSNIKGESYGPYNKGELIEVPNHVAILLLCKDVARTV